MREQIILANGVSESELIRTFARFGKNTFGLRVVSSTELAKIALMKSGISISEGFLSSKEQPSIIYSQLKSVPYFASGSFADAENLASSINTLRQQIDSKDEKDAIKEGLKKGVFLEKNDALFDIYERYTNALRNNNLIDSIGIIRKALSEASSFDSDFFVLKEYPLTPLDKALITKVSSGNFKELNICDFITKKQSKESHVEYVKGYGAINEAEYLISGIYEKHIPLDKCVIACANSGSYAQVFYDLSGKYGIPMTFGNGIPIINSNPAKLLKLILDWDTKGYNGIDALKTIICSEAFNREKFKETLGLEELHREDIEKLCKMAGSLRISFDADINEKRITDYKKVLEADYKESESLGRKDTKDLKKKLDVIDIVSKLSKEFELGIAAFIDKYAVIRQDIAGRIDRSSINVIVESLNAYLNYSNNSPLADIIPKILEKTVCSEISKEGALHITSINGAIGSLRDNLYVCGLSAQEFPGTPTENYLLLDDDLLCFSDKDIAPTSVNIINKKKDSLMSLLNAAEDAGIDITLSYSEFNLADLKDQNPSSVLYTVYLGNFKKIFKNAGYFDSALSASRLVGNSYISGNVVDYARDKEIIPTSSEILDRAWSPSALDIFFQCPRRFYLTKVVGLPEDELDDPFMVISAADIGTLAHSMMETLAEKNMNKSEFLSVSEKAFDNFLVGRPPIHPDDAKRQKKEFLKMMESAFDQDPGNEVLSAETEYEYMHQSGVKLHGLPDRVEKDKNGNLLIADFKTGRRIVHKENDIDSCFQVVVYAWLLEQAGTNITRCDYRYLRKEKTITCDYSNEMKDKLNEKLLLFKDAVTSNKFPRNETKDSCRYCKMKDICLWESDLKESEENE